MTQDISEGGELWDMGVWIGGVRTGVLLKYRRCEENMTSDPKLRPLPALLSRRWIVLTVCICVCHCPVITLKKKTLI